MSFENETFEGTEVSADEPSEQHDRSAAGTLSKLSSRPLEQAIKLCKYGTSGRAKFAKLTKLCSAEALELAKKNAPELF